MPRWFPFSHRTVAHFDQAGDSQAEERFELNAKAGAEERRGAKDNKVEDDDEENMLISRGTFRDFQPIPSIPLSVTE